MSPPVTPTFATNGTRAEPLYLRSVIGADGKVEESDSPQTRPVLDPRVAYLTTSLMEDVINRGTGASVRSLGFTAPAAGKTGTSHDGWFAGFTSNLLCVIWIGFDDNRDLGLSGGQTAAPIWAEFMKRAVTLPAYVNTHNIRPAAWRDSGSNRSANGRARHEHLPSIRRRVFHRWNASQPSIAVRMTAMLRRLVPDRGYHTCLARVPRSLRRLPIRQRARPTVPTRRKLTRRARRLVLTHHSQQRTQRRKKAFLIRFLVSLVAAKSLRTARNLNRRSGAEKGAGQ